MNTNDNRQNAYTMIDHIFHALFPAQGMAEPPAQVALCHQMLNAMLEGDIALCDAGTGIVKTYAYLATGTVYLHFRAASGLPVRPILISTSERTGIRPSWTAINPLGPFLFATALPPIVFICPSAIHGLRKGELFQFQQNFLKNFLSKIDILQTYDSEGLLQIPSNFAGNKK